MTRADAVRRLRDLADDLRTHLPHRRAELHAMQLDQIAIDIIHDMVDRP